MKTKKAAKEVLLILPPFSSSQVPYISLAVLAGYLKSVNIPVSVFDASVFLTKIYNEPQWLARGLESIEQCFKELNDRDQLTPAEAAKMTVLYSLINELNHYGADQLPPETVLQIAAIPFWPDGLVKRPSIKLMSADSVFASEELLQAARKDYFFSDILRQELRQQIAHTNPLIVGIAAIFDEQMLAALHCARLIKEIAPNIHVTMGGPFISVHMDELDNPEIFRVVDSLIFDEGEIPLQSLHAEIDSGTPDLLRVPGLMHLSQDNIIIKNRSIAAPDMETLPFADYSACNIEQYPFPVEKMQLSVRLSRGCYWRRCSFCRVNLSFCKNFQQPSVDRNFAEIEYIVKSTGVRKFLFSDESSHPLVLEKLSRKIIASKLDIKWSFHTRIDKKLTKERVALYRDAGCWMFHVGIETFNNRLLTVMQKGITEDLIGEVLEEIQGIVPIHAYMMVGIPGESEDDANRSYTITQEYIQRGLLQGTEYSLFQLVPGSNMWNNPEKYRITPLQSCTEQDLKPNICANFVVGDGMTRDEAFRLFFRYHFPDFEKWKTQNHVLTLAGESIDCRYPLGYLQECLHDSLIHQNDLPVQGWLAFLDQNKGPILPYRSTQ